MLIITVPPDALRRMKCLLLPSVRDMGNVPCSDWMKGGGRVPANLNKRDVRMKRLDGTAAWTWHIGLLATGVLLGLMLVSYTPLFFMVFPEWLENALGIACIVTVLSGLRIASKGDPVPLWRSGLRVLLSAVAIGTAGAVLVAVPMATNPVPPEPQERIGARLYIPLVDAPDWRRATVAEPPVLEVQGTPDSESVRLEYSFSFQDGKGQGLSAMWELKYPEDAEVSTLCKKVESDPSADMNSEPINDDYLSSDEHRFYCIGYGRVTVTLRGDSAKAVWGRVNANTRSIAVELPTVPNQVKALGIMFVSAPLSDARELGTSVPGMQERLPWIPKVTFTSVFDYWRSNWRWDEATSGIAVKFDNGFIFPPSEQIDSGRSPMVLSAAMSNPVEAQRLQTYRDLALLVLGGLFTFTAIYGRPNVAVAPRGEKIKHRRREIPQTYPLTHDFVPASEDETTDRKNEPLPHIEDARGHESPAMPRESE